ncbi:hypothetical protein Tco_0829863 [Tanacetum coccineum]
MKLKDQPSNIRIIPSYGNEEHKTTLASRSLLGFGFPKAKSLELKVDSKENNLQNTYLSPRLRHPNLKLANQKKILSPVLAKDKSPSHPSPPTPVVGEMHYKAQQAAGGPKSLGATSEEGANLQLNSGMSIFNRSGYAILIC